MAGGFDAVSYIMGLRNGGGPGPGPGGDCVLQDDITVSNPIGRYTMGEVITKGTLLETIFRGMLSKTYYPQLTDPSVTMTYNVPTLAKVGGPISAATLSLAFNRGSINPQYTAESPYRAGEATNYNVKITGASIDYDVNQGSSSFSIPTFTKITKGNVTITAKVDYARGVQPKDSDGQNYQTPLPAGSKTTAKNIEFILPFYRGKSVNTTINTLDGFTEDLSKKGQKSYTYNVNNEYMYLAYDASYGELTSILDENGFENLSGWQKSTLNYEGNEYRVYRSGFAITGANVQFTFKF